MYSNLNNITENVTLKQIYVSRDGKILRSNKQAFIGKDKTQVGIVPIKDSTRIRINLRASTVISWFIPALIDGKFKSKKNGQFGSGIPNALWQDDEIPTLNNIQGYPKLCLNNKLKNFYAFSISNFNKNKPTEYNHQGTECYLKLVCTIIFKMLLLCWIDYI